MENVQTCSYTLYLFCMLWFIFHSIIFLCVYSQYKVLFKVMQVASVIDKEMIGVKL